MEIWFSLPARWAVWFYLIGTAAAILWLAWKYALAVESTRWPWVQGKVIKAWVEETNDDGPQYSPRVKYIYKVDGITYDSYNLRITGDIACGKRRAQRIADYYENKGSVYVWYDPQKPARSTLKPGGAGWLMAGLIAVSILGPLLALASTEAGQQFLSRMGIHFES